MHVPSPGEKFCSKICSKMWVVPQRDAHGNRHTGGGQHLPSSASHNMAGVSGARASEAKRVILPLRGKVDKLR